MVEGSTVANVTNCEVWEYINLTIDSVRDLLKPCTKEIGRDGRCWLQDRTSEVTAMLLDIGMALREHWPSNLDGDVCLEFAKSTCGDAIGPSKEGRKIREAWRFAGMLLSKHQCIRAIEMTRDLVCLPSPFVVLKKRGHLQSLTAYGSHNGNNLEWRELLACEHGFRNRGTGIDVLFAALERDFEHLTTLDVAQLCMLQREATRLVQALIINDTIVDLAVSDDVLKCGEVGDETLFALYLAKKHNRLTKLKLASKSFWASHALLRRLVDAVCQSTVLRDLVVDMPVERQQFARTTGLFADVVTRVSSLRRLHLPSKAMRSFQLQPLLDANAAQYMESWLQALRSPNTALHELRISLLGFGQDQYRDFFGAVAENRHLEMVSLYSVPDTVGVEQFCGTIRSFSLSDRVTILNHVVDSDSISALPRCPEIIGVTVRSWMFPPIMGDVPEPVAMIFDELRCCDHVTSVRVRCEKFFGLDAACSLAAYIRHASFLTDVEVRLDRFETDFSGEERRKIEAQLALALACNTNLVRVSIEKSIVSLDDVDLLLSGARMNRNLTRFGMTSGNFSSSVYCDRWLNVLCSLTNVDSTKRLAFAHIQKCITRNTIMVRAAAGFALGYGGGIKGPRAIEQMYNHPDVLAMVQERAACRRSVARNMIEEALRRVQRCSLDDFMKFAGVVHAEVQCLRDQPGTGTRLFDLNEYCLLHIRSFLNISDVVDVSTEDI